MINSLIIAAALTGATMPNIPKEKVVNLLKKRLDANPDDHGISYPSPRTKGGRYDAFPQNLD